MASRFLTPFGARGLLGRDPFLDLHREVNRLFDDSFRNMNEGRGGGVTMLNPRVDVCPTDDGWEITAELPGVEDDDIDLRLDGDLLTISGEKRDQRKDDQNRLVERSYGSFTRSFQLPFTPDPDKVTASSDKGILTIKVPKGAEQERSRRISISGGSGKAIEGKPSGGPAIGKEWMEKSEPESKKSDLSKEQADKGQGAPA
ncbi:MAG TPA: Hsp20/alpha crystallin family protein [Sphingomicrobium sp.]|nr:Hsp20/alpha crystallin family protein [Sphingomicrobium sp.]